MKDSTIAYTVKMLSPPCPVAEGMKDESLCGCFPDADDSGGSAKRKSLQEGACRTKARNGSVVKSMLLLQKGQDSVPNT